MLWIFNIKLLMISCYCCTKANLSLRGKTLKNIKSCFLLVCPWWSPTLQPVQLLGRLSNVFIYYHSFITGGTSNNLDCVFNLWWALCVSVFVCAHVCVCVSIMPSLGFFISNQRAIDSPDFAPAQLFHWCVESDGPFRQKWNQIKNVKIMLSL